LRGSGRRTCAASICLSVLCCVAVYVVTSDLDSAVIREEGGDALVMESDFSNELRGVPGMLVQTQAHARLRSNDHDPQVVEARALRAVARAKQAAQALQDSRRVVVRLQELGDTVGAAAALRGEEQAKRAFITARAVSAPLVAEARANYEANQGSEIQDVAKQVAQDTWRSMTGVPLRDERGMYSDPTVARSVDSRREDIRRASLQVAGGYAAQARQAQAGAIAAQRQMDSMAYQAGQQPGGDMMGGDPSIIAIAKYAKQAQDAMRVTKATQAEIAKQMEALKRERQALAANRTAVEEAKKPDGGDEASDVIGNAEVDVAGAMRTVEQAAQQRGLVDNSWKSRIGDMVKTGNHAAANQAAKDYVQNHVDNAANRVVGSDVINSASDEVAKAQKIIAAKEAAVAAAPVKKAAAASTPTPPKIYMP